jgi:pectate lyase
MFRSLFLALAATASLVNASAIKRADDTPVGYASQNGGTTGGTGGSTTTVSSLAAFTAAAAVKDKNVIYVQGTISGAAMVKVASDTTILGVY